MKHIVPAICIISFLTLNGTSFALSKQATAIVAPVAEPLAEQTQNKIFLGTIEKLKTGTALFTNGAMYPLLGGDFENIVGKHVLITGQLIVEDTIEKIMVVRIQLKQ